MSYDLESYQFEEDDTVVTFPKSGGIRIGLVSEAHEGDSSSDEDEKDEEDEDEDDPKLKPGQVRVEWYPTGKETVNGTGKVVLIDRSLLIGEMVCRRSQPNRVGVIRKVAIRGDFLILPQCQYVVRNITEKRIEFVNKYDDASNSCYVTYENWAGVLMSSSDKLLLRSEDGYQCWISTNDVINDLVDCCTKRLLDSSYNTRQWYEGEPVKCTFKSLSSAKWMPNHKPPESSMKKWESNDRMMKFTVMKVEPEFIDVRWVTALSGPDTSPIPPASTISGEDLQKVRKLEHFEYQMTQIGDRIWVDLEANDSIVPYTEWKETFRTELLSRASAVEDEPSMNTANSIKSDDGKASAAADASADSLATAKEVSEEIDGEKSANSAPANQTDDQCVDSENEYVDVESTSSEDARELETNQQRLRTRLGVPAYSYPRPKLNVASGSSSTTPHRGGHKRRMKTSTKKTSPQSASRPPPTIPPPEIGARVAAEAICVRSYLTVAWQDGELEKDVPSYELAYASGDLDDHLFVPGNYVQLQEDDGQKTWPQNGYGVVEKVDFENRVATVAWFESGTIRNGSHDFVDNKFIRKDEVSVYDLVAHSDFDYPPGSLIMLISPDISIFHHTPIGQVIFTDPDDGQICVKWVHQMGTDETGIVYPDEICRAIGDYHTEEDEDDGETDGDDTQDDDSDSNWSTVSNGSQSDVDDQEDELANGLHEESPKCKPKDAIVSFVRLSSALDALQSRLVVRKNEWDMSTRTDLASALTGLYSTLKRTMKCWFNSDLALHRRGPELSSYARILRTWHRAVRAKENSSSSNGGENGKNVVGGGTIHHPANAVVGESQIDGDVALLCQVEEELKKFVNEPTTTTPTVATAMKSSTAPIGNGSTANSPPPVPRWMKVLDSLWSQIQAQGSPTSLRLQRLLNGSSSGLSAEDDEKLALVQRSLERMLERLRQGGESNNPMTNGGGEEWDGETISESTINECANRCFETNPKHKRVLAIIDLCIVSMLTFTHMILENMIEKEIEDDGKLDDDERSPKKDRVVDESRIESKSDDIGGVGESEVAKLVPIGFDVSPKEEGEVKMTPEEPPKKMEDESKIADDSSIVNSTEGGGKDQCSPTTSQCFELLEKAPSNHKFLGASFDASSVSSRFMKAVSQEMKLMQHLPPGIFVKGFEDRMDLYSCMLVGPAGTPFVDGLFFFDVRLKPTYPNEPPEFHFKSYSTEQLNPNLYQDGKVCVSLLGTWNGKDSEMWNPGSNLLQVLVSIQGLILNSEPFFNEAGYESKRAHPESLEKSRRYNELALIRNIESLWKSSTSPSFGFDKDVARHLAERGRSLIETVEKWIDGSTPCGFPLQPVSQGFSLSVKKQLAKFAQVLTKLGL